MTKKEFATIGEIYKNKKATKPTAYSWQELSLRIIKDLAVPPTKKSSVFKACKENDKIFIERCLNDTKELCKTGEKWKYFFKLINSKEDTERINNQSQKDVHKKVI